MTVRTVTKTGAKRILNRLAKSVGVVFYVRFVKRTNNDVRDMRCCFGIKENLKGKGLAFDPHELHLLNVYDLDKSQYRNVSLERIREIKVGEKVWKVQ